MFKYTFILFLLVSITFLGCNTTNSNKPEKPLNIILMVGDGMGLSQVSTAFHYNNTLPNFAQFKYIGLSNTRSANSKITDSAAGATAFSTGNKTYNGAIGVDVDTTPLLNIVEILSEKDYKTGLVVTSSITHATPAAFYAHTVHRHMEEEIASQLINSSIDFFAGNGIHFFNNRKDGANLLDSITSKGFYLDTVLNSNHDFLNMKEKYAFLANSSALHTKYSSKVESGNRGDYLPRMSKNALDYLSKNEEGFFLMIEGSQIDWAGHANDSSYLIHEVLDFDKTIGVVLDFASKNENTLVVVTADHETGGFALIADTQVKNSYNTLKPAFASTNHSATLVPVFAYGKGAENFAGVYENTEIFNKINTMLED